MVTLWNHQREAAARIASGEIQALWWQMRTGKTLAAIAGTDSGDRLIICPNSVKPTWLNDLKLWGQDAYVWGSGKKPKERPRNVVINYESLWRTELLGYGWDSIIWDESQRLQNPRTKLWAYIYSHLQDLCRARVVLLSGSPAPEGWHQLITQAITATGQFCGILDPWEALRAGWVYDDWSYKWVIQPGWDAKARAQLHQLGPSMTQAEAGINTRKVYQRMPVQAGPHEVRLWKATMKRNLEGAQLGMAAQSCASGRNPETGETLSSTKLDAVAEWVLDAGQPTVILCRFTSSLHYLAGKLTKLRVGLIHGDDAGSAARGKVIQDYNDGLLDTLICNVATVKVGLNLSHANILVFAENSFSGEARIQAEERCTVMGKELVEILDFVTDGDELLGEIDDGILSSVKDKQDFNLSTLREVCSEDLIRIGAEKYHTDWETFESTWTKDKGGEEFKRFGKYMIPSLIKENK